MLCILRARLFYPNFQRLCLFLFVFFFFFFNDTATTEIYTLSLHDALPISSILSPFGTDWTSVIRSGDSASRRATPRTVPVRSEEHTSELQSRLHLVCRLLLEKKNDQYHENSHAKHWDYHKTPLIGRQPT